MRFSTAATAVIAAMLIPAGALAATSSLSYDQSYDTKSTSLATVACSDGTNGLLTAGYTTFGSLPKFPYIGGAQAVAGWNSASCGSCWNLTYTNTKKVSKSISVLAVDHADSGFNIALEAMNALTGGIAEELGRISVTSKQIAVSHCGL
ncbi:Cerato-platanin [Athelia psychrophila]|uniref:Cerato-platanin n=1 Tax=Athelia psychrophila TaxID=1759441 RepID=A0A166VEM3_9AGAM|nr:Cerato-platanin [Fibularhizoctonia sp. CBS 109695]